MPINVAYDSIVPRSLRSRETTSGLLLAFFFAAAFMWRGSSIHLKRALDRALSQRSQLRRQAVSLCQSNRVGRELRPGPSKCVRGPVSHRENEQSRPGEL